MNTDKPVLILTGDDALVGALAEALAAQCAVQSVIQASTVTQALEILKSRDDQGAQVVLGVIDLPLVDQNIGQVIERFHGDNLAFPVLVLGSINDPDLKAQKNNKSYDVLTKPFKIGAFIDRMSVIMDRVRRSEQSQIAIGSYRFLPGLKQLQGQDDGRTIPLTDKEAEMLLFLGEQLGQVVSRDQLLDKIWGYGSDISTHTLETHIYRLRQKIEQDPANAQILMTEPGGYRLKV